MLEFRREILPFYSVLLVLSVGPRHSSRVRASVLVPAHPSTSLSIRRCIVNGRGARTTVGRREGLFGTTPLLPMESFVRSWNRKFAGKSRPAKTTASPRICKSHVGQKRIFACFTFSVKIGCSIFISKFTIFLFDGNKTQNRSNCQLNEKYDYEFVDPFLPFLKIL